MQIAGMKRKRTLHSWFASSSNTYPIVPETNAAPINFIVEPTDESNNPISDENTTPQTNGSINQPPPPRQYILEFHPSQIFGDPTDQIPIEDYAPKI